MFTSRRVRLEVEKYAVPELRGMEGIRVRALYGQMGQRYGVTWKGRDYDRSNWTLADSITRMGLGGYRLRGNRGGRLATDFYVGGEV